MRRSDLLFYILILYVFAAGCWWSFLLYQKNRETLEARTLALRYQHQQQGIYHPADFENAADYQTLQHTHQRKEWMIYGEGGVLLVLLLVGFAYVHRSRQKEWALLQQQRNFLLSITHELKSPLASIQLGLETVQRRPLAFEQSQKIANHALRDTHRLHQLIQNLLLAAKVETGYVYHFDRLDLREILAKSIESCRPHFSGDIRFDPPPHPVPLSGDETTLMGVFLNLLENAIKYAPLSPFIAVTLATPSPLTAIVEVRDLGNGIPNAEKNKIFDRFYRLGNEETRTSKGTGLGLFIVKQVTEAHRGKVSVYDNTPHGTVFRITLPCLTGTNVVPLT